jgi:hypothetical protein
LILRGVLNFTLPDLNIIYQEVLVIKYSQNETHKQIRMNGNTISEEEIQYEVSLNVSKISEFLLIVVFSVNLNKVHSGEPRA